MSSPKRTEVLQNIVARHPEAAIVFSNGLTAREAAHVAHRPGNFYMLHGMGEALSVGIGLRLARPDVAVVVVEGDGNAAMGLSAWTMMPMDGLTYYVLDNGVYETTGAQDAPRLPAIPSWVHHVPIAPGSAGTPVPPPPERIAADFAAWMATRPEEEE